MNISGFNASSGGVSASRKPAQNFKAKLQRFSSGLQLSMTAACDRLS